MVGDLVPKETKELPSTGTDSIVYKDKIIYILLLAFRKKRIKSYEPLISHHQKTPSKQYHKHKKRSCPLNLHGNGYDI